jgi:hypothetical protein
VGIPVYLRTAATATGVPQGISFDGAAYTVVALLIDDKKVLGREQGWGDYVQGLNDGAAKGAHRILPIKLSAGAISLNPQLRAANFLSLDAVPAESRTQRLMIGLLHDLCRLMQDERATEYRASDASAIPAAIAKPVRIFISDAKEVGEEMALKIREYITKNLQLDTFFAKNQIPAKIAVSLRRMQRACRDLSSITRLTVAARESRSQSSIGTDHDRRKFRDDNRGTFLEPTGSKQ